jgi:putative transcriptional regulator
LESSHLEAIAKIAGDIVVSPDPGRALKVWREKIGVKQIDLARALNLSPSVLSDYESGRRSSPGVLFIKKYIEALVNLDEAKERVTARLLSPENNSAILAIGEFSKPVKASTIVKAVEGEVIVGEGDSTNLYGYTVVDSIKTIYALSGYDFYRIFGATTERVIVFTKVGGGRSPLVAIRVSQLKPRMVVIHGPNQLDPLAVDLAKKENLILALSKAIDKDGIISSLKQL